MFREPVAYKVDAVVAFGAACSVALLQASQEIIDDMRESGLGAGDIFHHPESQSGWPDDTEPEREGVYVWEGTMRLTWTESSADGPEECNGFDYQGVYRPLTAKEWTGWLDDDEKPQTITQLVGECHQAAKAKGWHDGADPSDPIRLLAWMALGHSEFSEAVEDIRKGKLVETFREGDGRPEGLPSELADVVIRVFDTCGALGIDLEGAIRRKLAFNATRAHRHGGKAA